MVVQGGSSFAELNQGYYFLVWKRKLKNKIFLQMLASCWRLVVSKKLMKTCVGIVFLYRNFMRIFSNMFVFNFLTKELNFILITTFSNTDIRYIEYTRSLTLSGPRFSNFKQTNPNLILINGQKSIFRDF